MIGYKKMFDEAPGTGSVLTTILLLDNRKKGKQRKEQEEKVKVITKSKCMKCPL